MVHGTWDDLRPLYRRLCHLFLLRGPYTPLSVCSSYCASTLQCTTTQETSFCFCFGRSFCLRSHTDPSVVPSPSPFVTSSHLFTSPGPRPDTQERYCVVESRPTPTPLRPCRTHSPLLSSPTYVPLLSLPTCGDVRRSVVWTPVQTRIVVRVSPSTPRE